MSAASLRELEAAIAVFDVDGPVTWGQLQEKVAEAARAAEQGNRRPCKGRNANVCVAEGCYGEACVGNAPRIVTEQGKRL